MFARRWSQSPLRHCAAQRDQRRPLDLDSARSIIHCAIFGALCWLAAGVAFAAPTDQVGVCRGADSGMEGQVWSECSSHGGENIQVFVFELLSSDFIAVLEPGGYVRRAIASVLANDVYEIWNPTGDNYPNFSSLGWVDPDGEPDPPDEEDEDFSVDDIDFDKAAGAFGAAFLLVGMFWALGKGIGLVVNSVRRF